MMDSLVVIFSVKRHRLRDPTLYFFGWETPSLTVLRTLKQKFATTHTRFFSRMDIPAVINLHNATSTLELTCSLPLSDNILCVDWLVQLEYSLV